MSDSAAEALVVVAQREAGVGLIGELGKAQAGFLVAGGGGGGAGGS